MICLVLKIASEELTRVLQEENAFSELLVQILAVRSTRTQADLIDQLFNNSEPRPARTLLLMADDGNESGPVTLIPPVTHADMIGITRSRVSFFMNWFRKLGHISYKDHIRVHKSLLMMGFLRIGCRSRTRHVLSSPISESVGHESPSEPRSSGSRSPRINSRTQRTIHRFCAVFFGASPPMGVTSGSSAMVCQLGVRRHVAEQVRGAKHESCKLSLGEARPRGLCQNAETRGD
jgi:hypothetical protein